MDESSHVVLFFGLVGAGKGTQIELLKLKAESKRKEFICWSPGNQFRDMIAQGDALGKKVNEIITQGILMPDFITNALAVQTSVAALNKNSTLVFDGFPRSLPQAELFTEMTQFFEWKNVTIIFLKISESEAVRRMMERGRADDHEEGIRKRFTVYQDQVVPAINYVRKHIPCSYYEIDGERSREEIHEDIIKTVPVFSDL